MIVERALCSFVATSRFFGPWSSSFLAAPRVATVNQRPPVPSIRTLTIPHANNVVVDITVRLLSTPAYVFYI